MEVLSLIRLFLGWIFPYISHIHTAYVGEDSSIFGTCFFLNNYITNANFMHYL